MLQRSSRASPMVQPVASDHRESSCMPGCHGKHPPQPAHQVCCPVNQTTRDELRVPDGRRTTKRGPPEAFWWTYGTGQTPSGYGRGLQTNPVNNLCVSELVRRAQTFGTAVGRAQWTQRAPEQSAHSRTVRECADCSAGWLRQGAQPRAAPQNTTVAAAFQPFVTTLALSRLQQACWRTPSAESSEFSSQARLITYRNRRTHRSCSRYLYHIQVAVCSP